MGDSTTSEAGLRPGRRRFAEMYASGRAKWDTGRPQPEIVRLHRDGWIRGDVLDLGCGTAEGAHLMRDERGSTLPITSDVRYPVEDAAQGGPGRPARRGAGSSGRPPRP